METQTRTSFIPSFSQKRRQESWNPNGNQQKTGYCHQDETFSICLFIGSWLMGVLYDVSIYALIAFSVLTQLVVIPFFYFSGRETIKK